MSDGKKTLTNTNAQTKNDEEMYKHLDVLLNMDELEESDFWDEMMNLGELESTQTEGAKGSNN